MTERTNLSLEQRAMQGATMTPEERKRMWLSISDISEAQFDARRAERTARQGRVPQPGAQKHLRAQGGSGIVRDQSRSGAADAGRLDRQHGRRAIHRRANAALP